MKLVGIAFILLFAAPTDAQTSAFSNASTCHERCRESGLTTSKCAWICDGIPVQGDLNAGGNEVIAVSCYDKCRDDKTGHAHCHATCRVPKGNAQVIKSCYDRCRKDGTAHSHCEFTCR